MPKSSPAGEVRRLVVVIVAAALLIAAFKVLMPAVATGVGNYFAKTQVAPSIERSHRTSAAALAEKKFVPTVRQKAPALTKRASDEDLVEMAADVCQSLDDTDDEVQRDAAISRVSETLRTPSVRQARRIVDLAVSTACPRNKENLAG